MTVYAYEAIQQTRSQILKAAEMLINYPSTPKVEEATQILTSLWSQFLEKEKIYSIDSLVFNIFVQDFKNLSTQAHRDELIRLRDELSGKASHWHSYAIKNDLTESMSDSIKTIYGILHGTFKEYKKILENDLDEDSDILGELLEDLHLSCYQKQPAESLVELLVFQACHMLLMLPVPPRKIIDVYDEESKWGSFGNGSTTINIEDQINHIGYLLQKIKGELAVFVDVHIVSEGFLFSVR